MRYIPAVMAVGIGLSVNNTRAVLRCTYDRGTVRSGERRSTAWFGEERRVADQTISAVYHRTTVVELGLWSLFHRGRCLRRLQRAVCAAPVSHVSSKQDSLYTGLQSLFQQSAILTLSSGHRSQGSNLSLRHEFLSRGRGADGLGAFLLMFCRAGTPDRSRQATWVGVTRSVLSSGWP